MMKTRIDHLARLGTSIVTLSGGEPLLHPELDEIIAHMRRYPILSGMITNGYLLTADRIQRLNRAGLDHLQISIDNVMPDEVSKKSLKVLDRKLQLLAEHADFHVNINSVVGGGIRNPHDALVVGRRSPCSLASPPPSASFTTATDSFSPLGDEEREVFTKMKELDKRHSRFNWFQDNIAAGKPNDWRCRAGARYLYICEDGLVHYCSQQRGYPGTPLSRIFVDDIRREFRTEKGCAPNCTISCVHQVSYMDFWRAPQHAASPQPPTSLGAGPVGADRVGKKYRPHAAAPTGKGFGNRPGRPQEFDERFIAISVSFASSSLTNV